MRRTPLSRSWAERGMAPTWRAINGIKRSLTLDLRKPAAKDIIRRMVATSDAVMENFPPCVMDRLGLGHAALNPQLVYCAISGFAQTSPYRDEAGYDGKIPVLSGMTTAFAVSRALF